VFVHKKNVLATFRIFAQLVINCNATQAQISRALGVLQALRSIPFRILRGGLRWAPVTLAFGLLRKLFTISMWRPKTGCITTSLELERYAQAV
jgi:hypothetical protein